MYVCDDNVELFQAAEFRNVNGHTLTKMTMDQVAIYLVMLTVLDRCRAAADVVF